MSTTTPTTTTAFAFVRIRIAESLDIPVVSRRAGCRWLAVFIHLPLVGLYHLSLPCPLFSRAMDGEGGWDARGEKWSRTNGREKKGPDLRSGLARLVSGLDRAPEHPRGAAHFFIPPIKGEPDSSLPRRRVEHGDRGIRGVSNAGTTSSVQILFVDAHSRRNVRKVPRAQNSSSRAWDPRI